MTTRTIALCILVALAAPAGAVGRSALLGTWEAAQTPDDQRLSVTFHENGKAEIVSEFDFQMPGNPAIRRGHLTTYAKWTLKGDDIVLTYDKVREHLRYVAEHPLSEVGLTGVAPALMPAGLGRPDSRVRVTLWKAPHEYKSRSATEEQARGAAPAPVPAAQTGAGR
jgi:hypothetical protein